MPPTTVRAVPERVKRGSAARSAARRGARGADAAPRHPRCSRRARARALSRSHLAVRYRVPRGDLLRLGLLALHLRLEAAVPVLPLPEQTALRVRRPLPGGASVVRRVLRRVLPVRRAPVLLLHQVRRLLRGVLRQERRAEPRGRRARAGGRAARQRRGDRRGVGDRNGALGQGRDRRPARRRCGRRGRGRAGHHGRGRGRRAAARRGRARVAADGREP